MLSKSGKGSRSLQSNKDAVIILFSVGLQEDMDDSNLREIKKAGKDLYPHLQNIFLTTEPSQVAYLFLLKAINKLTCSDPQAADFFMERVFSVIRLEIITTTMHYKQDMNLHYNFNDTE